MAWSVFSYSIYPWALEIGGRYQNVHESLNTCVATELEDLISEIEAMLGARPTVLSLAPALLPPTGAAEPIAVSKGFAEVFGVLAEPNEANAPEPRPKALEAPVGEVRPPPGVVALKEPFLAEEGVSPPVRLLEKDLESEPLVPVERESLLVLRGLVVCCGGEGWGS